MNIEILSYLYILHLLYCFYMASMIDKKINNTPNLCLIIFIFMLLYLFDITIILYAIYDFGYIKN